MENVARLPVGTSLTAAPPRLLSGLTSVLDAFAIAVLFPIAGFDVATIAYVIIALVALAATGTGGNRIRPRLSDDVGRILGALATPMLALAAAALAFVPLRRQVLAVLLALPWAAICVLVARFVLYELVRRARARRDFVEPTIIVGTGPSTAEIAETLRRHPEYGLYPVGALDHRDEETTIPRLGDLSDLVEVVGRLRIRRIIITHTSTPEHDLIPVLRACDSLPVEVHVLPRLYELGVAPTGPTTDDVWGIPLVRLRRAALRTAAWRTKRLFDVVVGGLLLVLAAPVFAAAAIGVRLSGPGPIFFRQCRVGQRGELFELLKFRTLKVNGDSDTTWSARADPRQTRVGRFLRKTGLDELPQLLNVVAGSMSLVGPRPERPYFVDQFRVAVPRYDDRHRVPAGLTGWAQVHGLRGDTSIEDRAVFDNYYIENWSFWRDLVILARTAGTVLRGDGG